MINLIKLITQISDNETIDFEASMNPKQKERVIALISNKLENSIQTSNEIYDKTQRKQPVKRKIFFKRKGCFALILAATFLFGMVAIAANEGQWDLRLMEYWNLTDTTYLNDGAVAINQKSNVDNHMSITAVSSIGDKNNVAILLETDITDDTQVSALTLPKDSFYHFGLDTISILNKNGSPASSGFGTGMSSFVENGKLYFLLDINCEDINRLRVNLVFKDLYLYENDGETKTLIKEGTWNLDWTYQYAANVKTYHPYKLVDCNGVQVLITKVEVSPISIGITGVKSPFDSNLHDSFQINKISLAGNRETADFRLSTCGYGYRIFLDSNIILNTPTNPENILGIQIGNTWISLK